MGTSSINSALSSTTSQSISELLGQTATSSSTKGSSNAAIQSAVNAILNSATQTAGSGIDVQSTVDAILQIAAAPEIKLQSQVTTLNNQTAALQGIQGNIAAFQTSLNALTDFTGDFGALTVNSTNNSLVSATAANGTAVGTHSVTVTRLATTAADYSTSFSSATAQLPTGQFALNPTSTASDGFSPVSGRKGFIFSDWYPHGQNSDEYV